MAGVKPFGTGKDRNCYRGNFRVTVIPAIPKSGCLVARSPSTGSLDFNWYHSEKNTDSNAIRPSGAAPRPSVARVAGPRNEGVMK